MWGSRGDWRMAARNLGRNKRRNLATGVAIGLGFAALLALGGYLNRVHNHLRVYTVYMTRTGHLTIYKRHGLDRFSVKPAVYSLDAKDQSEIRRVLATMPNVEDHGGQLIGMGLIGNGCRTLPFFANGIDPALDRRMRSHPELLKWITAATGFTSGRGIWEFPPDLGAVTLANGLARQLHKTKVHDDFVKEGSDQKIVLVDCQSPDAETQMGADANVQLAAGSWSGMMSALDGEVVSTYNTAVTETSNSAILTSLTHLQKLYDTDHVTYWTIWLKDPRRLNEDYGYLAKELAKAGVEADLYRWDDEAISPFYTGTMSFLATMVSFLAFVLSTVVVFSIFNAATMTVIERGQEIGMMRSLGNTRSKVRGLFVREMLALAGISVAFGGIVGAIGMYAVNSAGITLHPPGVSGGLQLLLVPSALSIFGAGFVIFGLAVAATFAALRSSAKRNIAVLLMGSNR